MPGTALENGNAPATSLTNGTPEKDRKSGSTKSPNGLRKGFLNGQCNTPVLQEVIDIPEPEPVEYAPQFSQPAAPSHVTVSTTSITLQWKEVFQTGLTNPLPVGITQQVCVLTYAVEKQQVETRSTATGHELADLCKTDKWSEVYRGLDLTAQITDLRPGRRYAFRLLCFPTAQASLTQPPPQPPSQPAAFATPATEPDAPAPPSLSARARNSLTFKWREPEDTGGRDIFQYHLQMKPPAGDQQEQSLDEGYVELYVGLDLRYKVIRLTPGSEYRARVKAVNIIGASPWSEEALFTTPAALPSCPEGLQCTPDGPNSALVTWQTPADGGAPIFAYQLQRAEQESNDYQPVYKGEMSQCTVTGLESGQGYKFRVSAQNEEGKGPWSSILETQTAAVPPDSPSVPSTMGSNRTSVSIRWAGPDNDGGSQILGYEVELRPKNKLALEGISNEWLIVYQGEAPACTMGCLFAGCTYQVRIRAENSSGWGQYCMPTEVRSAPGVPHASGVPKGVSRSPASIDLEWACPRHDGGSDVASYRLEMSSGASTSGFRTVLVQPAAQGCQAEVQNLEPGTQYSFQVYAINSEGASPASGTGHVRTQAAAPCPPAPPQATAINSSSFKLSWSAPDSQGAAITDYTVSIQPNAASSTEPFSDLPNGNLHLNGHAHLTDVGGTNSQLPYSNGDTPSSSQGRMLHVKGAQTQTTVSDLQPFTDYSCQLQASNSAGVSDWSAATSIRTAPAATSAPVNLETTGIEMHMEALLPYIAPALAEREDMGTSSVSQATVPSPHNKCSSSSVSLQWQAPLHDNGSAVTSYHLEYANAGGASRLQHTWHKGYSGKERHCQVDNLSPGRECQFKVRAQSAQGQSPWSSTLQACTAADVPGPPTQPSCSKRTASGATVKWEAPARDNGSAVGSYRLEYGEAKKGFKVAYQGTAPQYKLQGLQAGTSYSLRVRAVNAVGQGSWSEEASFSTTRLPPLAPTQVDCAVEADPLRPVLTVSWDGVPDASNTHAQVASYELEVSDQTEASLGSSQRHTCSGKVQSFVVNNLQPGSRYQVRVRCVGSEGSGHGTYSEPVTVTTPGNRKAVSKAPSARSEVSSAAGDASSSALALVQSSKGKGRRDTAVASADDFGTVAVTASKQKPRGKRKGGSTAVRSVNLSMPPELLVIQFPKWAQRASMGCLPKKVVKVIPAPLLPAYRPCRSCYSFFQKRKHWLVAALLAIVFLAYLSKYGMPYAERPHPRAPRLQQYMANQYYVAG